MDVITAARAAAERARVMAEYAEKQENRPNLVKQAERLAEFMVGVFGDDRTMTKGAGVLGVVSLFMFAYAVYYILGKKKETQRLKQEIKDLMKLK